MPHRDGARRPLEQRLAAQETELARLRDAERIKDELLAVVSHDLRSPLTAILGYTRLMLKQRRGPLPEAYVEILHELERSGRYMQGLVDDLVDVARLGFGGLKLAPAESDAVTVVREAMDALRERAAERHITLAYHGPAAAVQDVDPRRVRQIVTNLLTNAVKFNQAHGRVDVYVRVEEAGLHVEMADTGVGIHPEELDSIFDMFKRLDNHKRIEGLGLGLTISKELVALHGGRIWVESTPGKGSRFHFTLPRERPEAMEGLRREAGVQPP